MATLGLNTLAFARVIEKPELEKLVQEVQDGKMSAAEAMAKITEILSNINNAVQDINATMTAVTDILKDLAEKEAIDNNISNAILSKMNELYDLMMKGQITANDFYTQMLEYMANNEASNKLIVDQLITNGMSQQQANAYLEKLLQEVKDGKVSAQEAFAKLTEILNSIDTTLVNILNELKAISDKITVYKECNLSRQKTSSELKSKISAALDSLIFYMFDL